eukprot:1531167-Ditylum_brightwellii.AAC.1
MHFLGMKLEQELTKLGMSIFMSYEATINTLVAELNLKEANTSQMSYQNGFPVDKLPPMDHLPCEKVEKAQQDLQSILDWLACGAR